MDKLYIVIPAYNEEMNITAVVREWHSVVQKTGPNSKLVVIDDGSRDRTLQILKGLQSELPQLVPLTKPNEGHGAAVLYGYNYSLEKGADFIFQTDSDGQTVPSEFDNFWKKRKDYSVLIGHRNARQDGILRILVTKTLKFVLWCIFGVGITDANTPFRLMRQDVLRKYILMVPQGFHLSNVLLTVLFVKYDEKVIFIPITFRPRQGGVNSINLKRIVKIGWQAVKDFAAIKQGNSI